MGHLRDISIIGTGIVNMSRCFGKIAHIENGIGILLRNTAMRSLSSLLPSQP